MFGFGETWFWQAPTFRREGKGRSKRCAAGSRRGSPVPTSSPAEGASNRGKLTTCRRAARRRSGMAKCVLSPTTVVCVRTRLHEGHQSWPRVASTNRSLAECVPIIHTVRKKRTGALGHHRAVRRKGQEGNPLRLNRTVLRVDKETVWWSVYLAAGMSRDYYAWFFVPQVMYFIRSSLLWSFFKARCEHGFMSGSSAVADLALAWMYRIDNNSYTLPVRIMRATSFIIFDRWWNEWCANRTSLEIPPPPRWPPPESDRIRIRVSAIFQIFYRGDNFRVEYLQWGLFHRVAVNTH